MNTQKKLTEYEGLILELRQEMNRMKTYLASEKFQGACNDRVAVHEVGSLMGRLDDMITETEDAVRAFDRFKFELGYTVKFVPHSSLSTSFIGYEGKIVARWPVVGRGGKFHAIYDVEFYRSNGSELTADKAYGVPEGAIRTLTM